MDASPATIRASIDSTRWAPDPTAPGPFSFAAPDRVRGMLANAGFHSVAINPLDARIGDECANYFRHADTRPGERNPI